MIETKISPPTTCFFPTKDLMPRNWHEIIAQLKFKTRDFGGFPWVFRFSLQCSMVFPWFSPKKNHCYCVLLSSHGFSPWVFHPSGSSLGQAHERFGVHGQCLFVVRPDHHVGFRCEPIRSGGRQGGYRGTPSHHEYIQCEAPKR